MNHQNLSKVIEEHQLLDPAKKVLIGVSAGIDSMVLTHLLLELGFVLEIVHCNFKLRGEESEEDEAFVKDFAKKRGLIFHNQSFDTRSYSEEKKISTQIAARELRYAWFHELLKKRKIKSFVLGHHADDNFETALFHLIKGGGWRQNLGIPLKNGPFVRPLIFFSKSSISNYARTQGVNWREDLSNEQSDYLRNKLRHEIVPQIRQINPRPEQTFVRTYLRNREIENLLEDHINLEKNRQEENPLEIDISSLLSKAGGILLLEEILFIYGYSGNQIEELIKLTRSKTGSKMVLPKAELFLDRGKIFIKVVGKTEISQLQINEVEGQESFGDGVWKWESKKMGKGIISRNSPWVESFDLSKLKFPLSLRPWKEGDWFKPLGMKGKKKISDFLIDEKVARSEKEEILVLCSGENIIWVAGYRMDERFKVTSTTKRVFTIRYTRP